MNAIAPMRSAHWLQLLRVSRPNAQPIPSEAALFESARRVLQDDHPAAQ
jgi:hypothetical protein